MIKTSLNIHLLISIKTGLETFFQIEFVLKVSNHTSNIKIISDCKDKNKHKHFLRVKLLKCTILFTVQIIVIFNRFAFIYYVLNIK